MSESNQAWLALAGALLGGSGLKFIEHLLNRGKTKDDSATVMRAELREDLKVTREELDRVENEVDEWRGKYYLVVEAYQNLRADLNQAMNELNRAGLVVNIDPPKKLNEILGGQ